MNKPRITSDIVSIYSRSHISPWYSRREICRPVADRLGITNLIPDCEMLSMLPGSLPAAQAAIAEVWAKTARPGQLIETQRNAGRDTLINWRVTGQGTYASDGLPSVLSSAKYAVGSAIDNLAQSLIPQGWRRYRLETTGGLNRYQRDAAMAEAGAKIIAKTVAPLYAAELRAYASALDDIQVFAGSQTGEPTLCLAPNDQWGRSNGWPLVLLVSVPAADRGRLARENLIATRGE